MGPRKNANTGRPPGKPWTAELDARLVEYGRMPRDVMPWSRVAENFEGRTAMACRQRYMLVRAIAAGTVKRAGRERKANGRICRNPIAMAATQAPPDPAKLPRHTSITAALFGDPLPGRSALDERRRSTSNPGDHHASDH